MILYMLYRIGYAIAMCIPIRLGYAMACVVAEACYVFSSRDRIAVTSNVRAVLGAGATKEEIGRVTRDVFSNFAKYLVDFFRFSKIDIDYIKNMVAVEGLENMDEALSKGRGVIALSAHIGNWELGALVVSMLRKPVAAVVLTHQNKRINDFFTRQRSLWGLKPVEIGISLRNCYTTLKGGGILAMLGDRDFSKNGYYIEFFGRNALAPKGPAVFSCRMGSAIVPCFLTREEGDRFRLVFEKPIYPEVSDDEEASVKSLMRKYLSIMESYVRRYPSQWYVFRNVWNNNE